MTLARGIALGIMVWPLAALAGGARAIPAGEEHPAVLEKLYTSPVGEVEFTDAGVAGHSGFLRTSRGGLMRFAEVRGPALCGQWFDSSKWSPLPAGCDFVYYDDEGGRFLSVRSEEMEESGLFEAARGKLRGMDGG